MESTSSTPNLYSSIQSAAGASFAELISGGEYEQASAVAVRALIGKQVHDRCRAIALDESRPAEDRLYDLVDIASPTRDLNQGTQLVARPVLAAIWAAAEGLAWKDTRPQFNEGEWVSSFMVIGERAFFASYDLFFVCFGGLDVELYESALRNLRDLAGSIGEPDRSRLKEYVDGMECIFGPPRDRRLSE